MSDDADDSSKIQRVRKDRIMIVLCLQVARNVREGL
jgi:hypothetical protein